MTASPAPAAAADAPTPALRRPARRPLGAYVDADGRRREIVARPGAYGSVLVIDEDAATLGDRRLVAHLPCDEPAPNALVVCELYLADPAARHARPPLPPRPSWSASSPPPPGPPATPAPCCPPTGGAPPARARGRTRRAPTA